MLICQDAYMSLYVGPSCAGRRYLSSPPLLFAHAFTGCDTTCRPHGISKITMLQKIQKSPTLAQKADVFSAINASQDDVIAAGDTAL